MTGTIQCDGEVFAKGPVKIPLASSLTVLDARQAGKPLPLEQEGGTHTTVLSGPAEFSVVLDTGMPLNIEAGRASFSLPVPMAGSAVLFLDIPGEHANAKINPGLITRQSTDNGRTFIEAALAPGKTANIWWTTREVTAPATPRETRFLSEVKTLASVSETDLRIAVFSPLLRRGQWLPPSSHPKADRSPK
ncbi:MAG TPA: hypothetical protein VMG30_18045 [Acidobacteriota bacterium]|nr:hypothetical protein [Acidobacteriota bacterium]